MASMHLIPRLLQLGSSAQSSGNTDSTCYKPRQTTSPLLDLFTELQPHVAEK